MNNKKVVIVNGKPRSGKDSFSKFVANYCDKNNKECDVWSTIDYEKEILEEIVNREYDPESDIDRGFLSDFKQLLNEYYDITFKHFTSLIEFFDGIFIIHSREWNEILRFKKYCNDNSIDFMTVYITGKNERSDFTNYSDKFCDDRKNLYDYKIENNENLEDLKKDAEYFCDTRLF